MGQAKLRKQEIAQLKANSAKQTKELIGFGTFYRDDKDDGVAISFNTLGNEPIPGFTKHTYESTVECGNRMIEKIKKGEKTVESIFQQLKEAIKLYNVICFGTEVRPQKITHHVTLADNGVVNIDLITLISVIMSDIYVLTELGVIKNDNYNGLHIMHMTDNRITAML
jgi:hypothetical protein